MVDANLPTSLGKFHMYVFQDELSKEHLAFVLGDPSSAKNKEPALVRIHSECLTGDVFGSLRCDCGPQLKAAMKQINKAGCGILLYLRQEGRGIGLINKLKAYQLQDLGYDTVEANKELGFGADERNFEIAAIMLKELGVNKVRLLTNNPQKMKELVDLGIEVTRRMPIEMKPNKVNKGYLLTKKKRLGHLLDHV